MKLNSYLRRPKGIFYLFASVYLGAFIAAIIVATQLSFFEGYVKDKLEEVPEALQTQLMGLPASASDLQKLSVDDQALLYDAWLQNPAVFPNETPQLLFKLNNKLYIERLRQTLALGSYEQRKNALLFLKAGTSPQTEQLIEYALMRAKRRKEADLVKFIAENLIK